MITAAVVAFLGGIVPIQEIRAWLFYIYINIYAIQVDDSNMNLLQYSGTQGPNNCSQTLEVLNC